MYCLWVPGGVLIFTCSVSADLAPMTQRCCSTFATPTTGAGGPTCCRRSNSRTSSSLDRVSADASSRCPKASEATDVRMSKTTTSTTASEVESSRPRVDRRSNGCRPSWFTYESGKSFFVVMPLTKEFHFSNCLSIIKIQILVFRLKTKLA